MELQLEWIRPIVFALFTIWLFSNLIWDFILTVIKTYERMRSDEASIFDFKAEIQGFAVLCVLVGWALVYLYRSFQEPASVTWVTWTIAGVSVAVAAWVNRIVENKWRRMDWGPIGPERL